MFNSFNRTSRLLVIQTIYNYIINEKSESIEDIFRDIRSNYFILNDIKNDNIKIYSEFALELINYLIEHDEALKSEISLHLSANWNYDRLALITRIILKICIAELINSNAATNLLLNEYTTISHGFLDEKDSGFVNAILTKISSKIRS